MTEAELLKEAGSLSDFELLRRVNTLVPMSEQHIASKIELQRRESCNRLWRTDLWAWLGFVLAVISLIVSAFKS
jgi:hypothetical protein